MAGKPGVDPQQPGVDVLGRGHTCARADRPQCAEWAHQGGAWPACRGRLRLAGWSHHQGGLM